MKDIISELLLLHLNGMAHLDIKPHNILYEQKNDQYILADFGATI